MRRNLALMVLVAAAGSITLAGCGTVEREVTGQTPIQPVQASAGINAASEAEVPCVQRVPRNVERVFPMACVDNWLSWGDVAVVGTVRSEARVPSEVDQEGPDHAVKRELELTVREVPWVFPGDKTGILEGDVIKLRTVGWWNSNGEIRPTTVERALRLAVGETYFIVVNPLRTAGTWVPVVPEAALLVRNEQLIADEQALADGTGAAWLHGTKLSDLSEKLSTVRLQPDVTALHDLEPAERVNVLALKNASPEPSGDTP